MELERCFAREKEQSGLDGLDLRAREHYYAWSVEFDEWIKDKRDDGAYVK